MIGGVGVEPVKSVRAYARYLCHLDSPDKVCYRTEDVLSLSGADYNTMIQLASDKYSAIGENKLRMMADEHSESDFIIMNGNRILIKRQKFEQYLDHATVL